jgi:hypothetical protein
MVHFSNSPVSRNNVIIKESFFLNCPTCKSEDIDASDHRPQPTNGWGCKCNKCGQIFSQVKDEYWPFSYDFSGM